MQLHQLQPKHKRKKKKRVGRGGKRGTYSGRGMGGQSTRAGRKLQPAIREYIKRYPKKKGYRVSIVSPKPMILNVDQLEKNFESESQINPQVLIAKGLMRKQKGKMPVVKILGRGKITKKVVIENCDVSKTARDKVEAAGGAVSP